LANDISCMKLLIALMLLTGIGVSYKNTIRNKPIPAISKRKTIDTLAQQIGIIKQIVLHEKPVYIIRYEAGYMNLLPSNLPAVYKKENTKVIFSGAMKEMHPMEDELGQYFVLNHIEVEQ
jgi:hypothetical protein